jgi:hypothetical protein
VGIRCVDHATLYQLKLALTSPTGCGRSVGEVCFWTKTSEFSFLVFTTSSFHIHGNLCPVPSESYLHSNVFVNLFPRNPLLVTSRTVCVVLQQSLLDASVTPPVCLSVCLSMALQPFVGPWPSFQFLDLLTQSVGLFGRVISASQGLYLNRGQHKQNKHTQTSMPRVGFGPTIPVFERAKTVHALDRAATVIGCLAFQVRILIRAPINSSDGGQ